MAMQPWFPGAKLGIFLHYGIYAVDGVAESWAFYNGDMPHDRYMQQLSGFTASKFDPAAWAELFVKAGARYAVLTTRHHDGVALWDTAFGDLNVVRHTPAGRDLVASYVDALRQRNLRVGLYYSHSDWNHPLYASVRCLGTDQWVNESPYVAPKDGQDNPVAWGEYLAYRDGQVRELTERFQPDLLWFDGEWERAEQQWGFDRLATQIKATVPEVVLNGRLGSHGDYATPEQGVPMTPPAGPWELCLTVNDSWGYRHTDSNQKSVRQLIRYFAETIGAGGNLLLAVGPKEDGTIPSEQAERLEGLGTWIRQHAEAIYDTVAGLPPGYHYGPSTLSADRRTLFLICFDGLRETVGVRGVKTAVGRVRVVGCDTELGHRIIGGFGEAPGVLWIDAPQQQDPYATVIAVEFDGELEIYRGSGRE